MHRTVFIIIFILLFVLAAVWYGLRYFGALSRPLLPGEPVVLTLEAPNQGSPETTRVPYTVETVANGLFVPWSLVFTSPDRLLVTERSGAVRIIKGGALQERPLYTFPEVRTTGEEGLMGLTPHPDYPENKYLYFSLARADEDGALVVSVVRLTDGDTRLFDKTTIIDQIPAAAFHAGSRIRFGPDRKLYVTTGDATDKAIAQDPASLGGKILRINDDGSIPSDNPFPGSPIWSLGHRNPQGIDWHPLSGALYETEHGPSLFDGPAGGDEVNRIEKGGNYGWPLVSHEKSAPGLLDPLLVFTPAVAPASGTFYRSTVFPQFVNAFLFGGLRGEGIFSVFIDPVSGAINRYEKLPDIAVGRIRDIVTGPDGLLYFSTSNRDGRGTLRPGDDHIYRLIPSND